MYIALLLAVAAVPVTPAPVVPPGWTPAAIAGARAACAKFLVKPGVAARLLPPIGGAASCGAPAPISVTRIADVELVPAATLTCPMAAALEGWVAHSLKPAARRNLGTQMASIRTASSYVCRSRNNIVGTRMSEHARANALDMAGFTFAPRKIDAGVAQTPVKSAGNDAFLAEIRAGGCKFFTTVLGPGSDVFHGDHFHVDLIARSNGYRICQ